jgi:hypothetical protein
MNNQKIENQILLKIEDIEARLKRVESHTPSREKLIEGISKIPDNNNSLADHIIALRDHRSFKQPLTPEEVYKKINKIYPCDFSRVKVCLLRLQRRRQLRKTSKLIGKKKYVAYVW